jgi:hypothetical protein
MAAPGIPHQFYGTVKVNGKAAPDGTVVSARIDGKEVSSGVTTGGKYGQSPDIFIITDANNNRAGDTIAFFVAGKDSGKTYVFENGASTELNLAVTKQTSDDGDGGSSSGGSSGSSGGSSGGGGGGGGTLPGIVYETANYLVDGLNITRSYYYDGDYVIMKMVYQNTLNETVYNVEVTDNVGGDYGTQEAYFHSIESEKKKYDEYELGKWVSLFQMNDIILDAPAPEVTIGQIGEGETKEETPPEPEKPETVPRDEGTIEPVIEEPEPEEQEQTSAPTGLFASGTLGVIGLFVIALVVIGGLVFFVYKKKK